MRNRKRKQKKFKKYFMKVNTNHKGLNHLLFLVFTHCGGKCLNVFILFHM